MKQDEAAATTLADREIFRARVEELLVDLAVAARRITTSGDPAAVARRALELLLEEASGRRQA